MRVPITILAVLLVAGSASTTNTPRTYYNAKLGVSAAQYTIDRDACFGEAAKSLRSTAMAKDFGKSITSAESCMVAKGYKRVEMTRHQAEVWNKLRFDQFTTASTILASGGDIERLLSN